MDQRVGGYEYGTEGDRNYTGMEEVELMTRHPVLHSTRSTDWRNKLDFTTNGSDSIVYWSTGDIYGLYISVKCMAPTVMLWFDTSWIHTICHNLNGEGCCWRLLDRPPRVFQEHRWNDRVNSGRYIIEVLGLLKLDHATQYSHTMFNIKGLYFD